MTPHEPIKAIVIGASGSRKTSALCSLLIEGYRVALLDFDNGEKIIRNILRDNAAALERFSAISLTERMKITNGRIFPVTAKAWTRAGDSLQNWKGNDGTEWGSIEKWDSSYVLAIDTMSTMGSAAFNYHLAANDRLSSIISGNEYQRAIGTAQAYVIAMLELLHSRDVHCNVIVNTHVSYCKPDGTVPTQAEKEIAEREKRLITLNGYPASVGKSAGPKASIYFNDVLYMHREGNHSQLWTVPKDNVIVKTCAPGVVKPSYPQPTALAEYFKAIRDLGAKS